MLPPIEVQHRIADILWVYDDLIENNQKQIKLLEEAAQRLYKEWFVDLRFPGHETTPITDGIPEGWTVQSMNDIAEYINGYAFKPTDWGSVGKPIIKIKEMGSGVTTDTPRNTGEDIPEKYNVTAGDILFSWSATLSAMIWDEEDGLLNQHLFKVIPGEGISREFVLQSILKTLDEFSNLTTGSTMKHLTQNCEWYEVYDFIDIHLSSIDEEKKSERSKQYNKLLEQEKSGYRIIAGEVAPITNETEIQTIEQAASTPYLSVNQHKRNFMDLFENFILYDHSGGRTVKILARNHQYLGVNEAVEVYKQRKLRNGRLGVFWHTQGSGKSYSMLFLAQKIRRKFEGSPTFVVLTDRDELNKQISDTFENCGLLGGVKASKYIAQSGEDLISKLKSNPSFIFTLIQKFNKRDAEPITPNYDIIIMSDEAHRSQYGIFAENMVALLPTASRIGFTGTPLFANDSITERTFGGYISVYDFKRAVDDGATVPLYYENRGEKLGTIKNPEITQEIIDAIEAADLDTSQQEKLELEFAKEIHVLTAEPRLEAIAKDFVEHYTNVWTSGKAMFVCLNKVTCVRMYNLAQKYWAEKIAETEAALKKTNSQQAYQELERKLQWLKETEMAVVISQEQNEIQTFKKWGLDILPHRAKMEKRELDKEFKDSANPFRIVFVCAMWLTGFDVKSLSCLYLDKPLKAHTLMQTIARANRVAEGKSNGLIVDYIGIVKALRKALADYTANTGGQGGDPTVDKEQLIARIVELIEQAKAFLGELGFDLSTLVAAKDFAKQALIKSGADAVCCNMEDKKEFQTYASELVRVMKYLQREDLTEDQVQYRDAIVAIYKELQLKRKHADNTDLMVEINRIISENLTLESVSPGLVESKQFSISRVPVWTLTIADTKLLICWIYSAIKL